MTPILDGLSTITAGSIDTEGAHLHRALDRLYIRSRYGVNVGHGSLTQRLDLCTMTLGHRPSPTGETSELRGPMKLHLPWAYLVVSFPPPFRFLITNINERYGTVYYILRRLNRLWRYNLI